MLRRIVLAMMVTALALSTTAAASAWPPPWTKNVANRGASFDAPENTLAAMKRARGHVQPQVVKVQVQRSKDNHLVVIHDRSLARTTDVEQVFPTRAPWNVADFTLAEIKQLDAGSWKNTKYKGERVPTLPELLVALEASFSVLIAEVRNHELYPGIELQLTDAIITGGEYWKRRVQVQSIDWEFVQTMHVLLPSYDTGVIGAPRTGEFAEIAHYAGTISVPHEIATNEYVAAAHDAGLRVEVWTVDDVEVMEKFNKVLMTRYRVNAIITNRPDVLARVLAP